MEYTGLLPIGSVVALEGAEDQDIMITGYCVKKADEEGKLFDYCGCTHPIGMMSRDKTLLFDHDQIQRVRAVGYISDASYAVLPEMEKILAELRKNPEIWDNPAPSEE